MNPDTITVRRHISLDTVLNKLRILGAVPDNTLSLFVTDQNERYVGTLPITTLVTHDPGHTVQDVMDRSLTGIDANTPATDVAQVFQDKDLVAAPVIDEGGKLIGVITVDDVMDVIREQADHEILGMAGLDEEDDIFAPVTTSARRRAVRRA